jgi:hypothetical protein
MEIVTGDWSCHSCKEKTEEYLQARHAYITELLKRFSISRVVHLWRVYGSCGGRFLSY